MNKYSLYILLTLLTTLAGCAKMTYDQDQNDRSEPDASDVPVWTLTVSASKGIPGQAGDDSWGAAGDDSWGVAGDDAGTKALELVNEGATLNAYWVQDEKVGVYVNGAYAGQLLATPCTDATKATLSGTITAELQDNDAILLLYPDREDITEGTKWDYTGQAGAAPAGDLAAKYDYATATLTVTGVDGSNVTTSGTATFENQQSIYRLDFKVNSSLKSVNWFSVSSSRNKLVTSRSYSSGWTSAYGSLKVSLTSGSASSLYMSLRNENTSVTDTYSFQVMGGDDALYSGTKAIPADKLDKNGKFLAPSITLSQPSFTPVAGNITDAENIL